MNKQSIFGVGNNQIIINGMKFEPQEIYKGIDQLFDEYDKQINLLLPNKIVYSKMTNAKKDFKSSKIFASLVKIDIPLKNAFHIVHIVLSHILDAIENGEYKEGEITPHDIRKMVARAIINYRHEDVPVEEIESWGDRYVRRYGHDSQRVMVYYDDSDKVDEIGHSFIKSKLLEDIFLELGIREKTYKKEIPNTQISSICDEIVEFVNDCNMYKIKYNILKEFVKEMSLQPPHPWFVTSSTAKRIYEYDLEILRPHYEHLCNARDTKKFDDLYYRINEALHHSCSSILARYKEVLGCNDLDVFFNLERITKKLYTRTNDDLLIENYEINNLPSDLKYIGIELKDFYELLVKIKKTLNVRKNTYVITANFVNLVLSLCEIAISLGKNIDKEDVELFLGSKWSRYEDSKKKEYIKRIFDVVDKLEVSDFIPSVQNCFWVNRKTIDIDKKILLICLEKEASDTIREFVNRRTVLLHIESILIIIENDTQKGDANDLKEKLDNERYYIEIVNKNDLQIIFRSNNKYSEFNKILKRALYS